MRRREAGWPTGTCPDEAKAVLAGVRSPPLRWGEAEQGWPSGENPGITRRVVFPEGRTLCARLAWPNVCRGITLSWDGRSGPGRLRGHARVKPIPPLRACGARPSAGRPPHMDGLAGRTWDRGERRFFRRGALCAPGLRGITNGKDFHYRRWLGERSVV